MQPGPPGLICDVGRLRFQTWSNAAARYQQSAVCSSPVVQVAPGHDGGQGVRRYCSQAAVMLRLAVLSPGLPEGSLAVPQSQRVVGHSDATCADFAHGGRLICTMLAPFHRQTHPCSFSLLDMGRGSWLAVMIPVSSPPQVRGAERRCGQCMPARCGQGLTDRGRALKLL